MGHKSRASTYPVPNSSIDSGSDPHLPVTQVAFSSVCKKNLLEITYNTHMQTHTSFCQMSLISNADLFVIGEVQV